MTRIVRSADCGNSPNNKLTENLSVALATVDTEFLLRHVTADVRWHIAGSEVVEGAESFATTVGKVMRRIPLALTIHHVVTRGRAGAAHSHLLFGESASREFCDVFEFSSAKGACVTAITSYWVDNP